MQGRNPHLHSSSRVLLPTKPPYGGSIISIASIVSLLEVAKQQSCTSNKCHVNYSIFCITFFSIFPFQFVKILFHSLQLKVQNIVEVYMFLIINVLAISYAGVQVYQFRGFGDECDAITFVGYLALANVSGTTLISAHSN